MTREHGALAGRVLMPLDATNLAKFDAVLISTDHDAVNYAAIAQQARLIIDTRNAIGRRGLAQNRTLRAWPFSGNP